jgi:hypothetical protein
MKTKASEFDRAFDEGEDITDRLEIEKARRVNYETRRVNVDFPDWMIQAMDREARRLGVTRQALIKLWIAEQLDRKKAS